MSSTAGLVLAAGEGRRFGGPKAPYVVDGERLVDRAVRVLGESGCDPVLVVLGAWRGEVPGADVVVNESWAQGMGSSLRAGLQELARREGVDRVLVTLVDLPGMSTAAVRRVLTGQASIIQASYDGALGHPVVLAREHWQEAADSAVGDRGARDFLRARGDQVEVIEVGDVASGTDLDTIDEP